MTESPRRRSHAPRRGLAVLRVAKVALVGAAATTVLAGNVGVQSGTTAAVADRFTAEVDQLMHSQQCSFTGFGPGIIPSTALLRTTTDGVRVVSFARGWAAYEGRRPGTLIAVCKGPA